MADYKDLFIVTSALVTAYGLLPTNERVQQTLETLASIKAFAPHADIVVLELSRERIPAEYEQLFLHYQPRDILHFSEYQTIKNHYQMCSTERDPAGSLIKNLNEIAATQAFFTWALQNQYLANYRRVFKISGRYSLCAPFDAQLYQHPNMHNRCVFLKQSPSYLDVAVSGNIPMMYMTRLWSFDPVLLPKLAVWFEVMLDMLLKRLETGGYIDIENLLALVIPRQYCAYLEQVGVKGVIGLHGQMVVE